jgi:TRAP-type C4-dicarboxylate transport system permease small subunit
VDILLNSVGEAWRALLNAWSSLLAIAICLLITYHGILSTIEHFQRGIPVIQSLVIAKYLLLWIIPFGTFLLLLQFINDFVFYTTQFILQLKQKLSIKQGAKP